MTEPGVPTFDHERWIEHRLCGGCLPEGRCRLGLVSTIGEDGSVRGEVTFARVYEGGPGVVHGGFVAAVFDEVLGMVPIVHGAVSVTKSIEVRFRRPVPVGRPLAVEAVQEHVEEGRRRLHGTLRMAGSDTVLAEANAVFVDRTDEHWQRHLDWLARQDTGEPPA